MPPTLLQTLLLTLLTLVPLTTPLSLPPSPPTAPAPPNTSPSPTSYPKTLSQCPNALQNPSFESNLPPWMDIVTGSFQIRGAYTGLGGGHDGPHFYYARSNSSIDATIALSQSFTVIPGLTTAGAGAGTGAVVECAAWVASFRPGNVGETSVEVFLDGVSCGGARGLGISGWTRVGGRVGASELGPLLDGGVHTLVVVVISYGASEEGWQVWVDDVVVGVGC
ncbi:hypothetical protein T440DRAFT_395160 [Plenodomus tracheiphilus IPT5]|uniref:Carbohydrate-binding module family 35 protein n=1 Tax=Plenodomus tracheiphilus IPT5 TaxID=1408161 RepID=A0A6A7B6J5_9PLEO|nr:hypothetical protein T440DRAFT_395160 [Plenodomus tracheiphilus IPT5]